MKDLICLLIANIVCVAIGVAPRIIIGANFIGFIIGYTLGYAEVYKCK
jgi:hypothetical protein